MEHAYLRYKLEATLGLNTTRAKNVCFLKNHTLILTAQGNVVSAYNLNLSEVVQKFLPPFENLDETISVTDIATSPNGNFLAIGYTNGEIVVYDSDGELINHFYGHRRAISCLAFHEDSNQLASGSLDNDIILWDISGDTGICRFVGHSNAVTDLTFIPSTQWLVSASKDTHIRVWDLEIQSCVQTMTAAASEVWALLYVPRLKSLVCAGRSPDFFLFSISDPENVTPTNSVILTLSRQLSRQSSHRIQSLAVSDDQNTLVLSTTGKTLELWNLLTKEAIDKKRRKRNRALKKKEKEQDQSSGIPDPSQDIVPLEYQMMITLPSKSCALRFYKNDMFISLASNCLQRYHRISPQSQNLQNLQNQNQEENFDININQENSEQMAPGIKQSQMAEEIAKEEMSTSDSIWQLVSSTSGHTTDIRATSITETQIISAGDGQLRVWDIESKQCVNKIENCGYVISMLALPGDNFIILGTKDGQIQMVDLARAEVYDAVQAHSATIWSFSSLPDFSEIASGSEDHEVRFWGITFENDRPILQHHRTLKLTDEVYSVAYSPNGKFIAVSLLDSTVRIFHTDSLAFHLSLYGNTLPATIISYSDDGELIATGSVDKNLRIWGGEFGDLHRSLWAHDLAVVCVRFIPGTHLCWTCGRDGVIKLWDCDRFLCVQTLREHLAEIWSISVSEQGQILVSGGRDKGIRLFSRTNEQLFVSTETQNALDRRMEKEAAEQADKTVLALRGTALGGAIQDVAAIKTSEAIAHGDELADAVTLADEEENGEGGNPILRGLSPQDYVLNAVKRINRANMEVIIQGIPLHSAISLLKWMVRWLNEGKEVELTIVSILCLIKHHGAQMERTEEAKTLMKDAKDIVHLKINERKNRCGMNLAALKLISHEMKAH